MKNQFKQVFYRHYWRILAIATFVAITVIYIFSKPENLSTSLTAFLGVILSIVYFVQKQYLDETRLFNELFVRFNERYERINEKIRDIFEYNYYGPEKINDVLDDYFNLCGEEYLFYREGRILPIVWKSWAKGMLHYLSNSTIKEYFDAEVKGDSHYGLSYETIVDGSNLNINPSRSS